MTGKTPKEIHAQLSAYSDSRHAAWQAIIRRCETGEAFTREDQTQMLEVMAEAMGLESLLIGAFMPTPTSPKGPAEYPLNDQHIAEAQRVTTRVLKLEQQLCGAPYRSNGRHEVTTQA